ncbi:hypothetical protein BZA05DRAFT_333534 [Tricharina praecox]|uniref:uncharacterized protein n=1 Tax=Tricharina praecox TaxID=43433 RepID=UPI00221F611F|nr:uncharacterized protein BZA05DRAFT_333534 [Tricharina praecox]KAI5855618.1 hypothetical protein BZA05DRAFT_333534 [Tricharina praecox]
MKFLDSVFNAFLSREQRERVSQNKWDKSIAAAAAELCLESNSKKSIISTPRYAPALITDIPTSQPMTPSLSSSSSTTTASSTSSPTRSRPSTSYSTSPRPEFRRHTSITRQPINYDNLMTATPAPKKASRRASNEAAPSSHQLLYPLPPLGPMEGIGKYRRSVDVTDEYLSMLQRNTLAALQPLIAEDDRVSRFKRDTTTPPRAYSVSPPMERQLAMQRDLEKWAGELEEAGIAHPILEDRPVRVASKRRAHAGSRERSKGGAKRASGQRQGPQAQGGISRGVKGKQGGYKSRAKKEMEMSASMETLVSGEE